MIAHAELEKTQDERDKQLIEASQRIVQERGIPFDDNVAKGFKFQNPVLSIEVATYPEYMPGKTIEIRARDLLVFFATTLKDKSESLPEFRPVKYDKGPWEVEVRYLASRPKGKK